MQFTATYLGSQTNNVTWSVDGVIGGNSTVGVISTLGLYTAPSTAGNHAITATSIADQTQSATVPLVVTNYAGTFTNKNDNLRTGQNLQETVLTSGNVTSKQFGKLFSAPVDGYVFAQPLYVANVTIPNQGVHNVVYVATEYDSVFAFDADSSAAAPLWQTSFIDPNNGITPVPALDVEGDPLGDIPYWVGITGTPVIDPAINTLFVVVRTKEVVGGITNYVERLHALDITTGAEQSGSPVVIQATVNGTVAGSSGGQVSFDNLRENSRPGLLLLNGIVYVGFGSLEDIEPYHGWILGYDEHTLLQVTAWNNTPNGSGGGLWQGGLGLAADSNGNIFVAAGDGTFDVTSGGVDYGQSVVKLVPSGNTLAVNDYFASYNESSLSNVNWDLGSGGIVLLPDQPGAFPHVALAGGKGGTLFMLNRDALGHFSPTGNNILLTQAGFGSTIETGGSRNGAAYWSNQLYYIGSKDVPAQFSLFNGQISPVPVAVSTFTYNYPGGSPVISANGSLNGIVWAIETDQYATNGPAILRAFDAANVAHQLYSSAANPTRDKAGPAVKFAVPTVANGKVYVGTQTELDVYGLQP